MYCVVRDGKAVNLTKYGDLRFGDIFWAQFNGTVKLVKYVSKMTESGKLPVLQLNELTLAPSGQKIENINNVPLDRIYVFENCKRPKAGSRNICLLDLSSRSSQSGSSSIRRASRMGPVASRMGRSGRGSGRGSGTGGRRSRTNLERNRHGRWVSGKNPPLSNTRQQFK